ncbi:hypothetical protein ACFOW1_14525 [Parasediminibacterium paludis]|uniref:GT2 family glycosyltransferase n=1 Tax=Parasediminibacterium paludis TaxID=908966 RepID=A0ABV8Q1A7_9BACT
MLLVTIVLYKKKIVNSSTLLGLIESKSVFNANGCKLLLVDNSPETLNEIDLKTLHTTFINFEYKHFPENKSLASIYNEFIKGYSNATSFEYLVLLDDDSKVSVDFINTIISTIETNYDVPLLLPIVYNNKIIVSPALDYVAFTRRFKQVKPGRISSKFITAINSGMVISLKYIKKIKFHYDESLTNYGTDDYFMKHYRYNNKSVIVMPYKFTHSLSFFDNDELDVKIKVFKACRNSKIILYKDNFFHYSLALFYAICSSLKQSVKYRTIKFLYVN